MDKLLRIMGHDPEEYRAAWRGLVSTAVDSDEKIPFSFLYELADAITPIGH